MRVNRVRYIYLFMHPRDQTIKNIRKFKYTSTSTTEQPLFSKWLICSTPSLPSRLPCVRGDHPSAKRLSVKFLHEGKWERNVKRWTLSGSSSPEESTAMANAKQNTKKMAGSTTRDTCSNLANDGDGVVRRLGFLTTAAASLRSCKKTQDPEQLENWTQLKVF